MTSKSPSPADIVECATLPTALKDRLAAAGEAARQMDIRERALQLATLRAPEGTDLPALFQRANEIYRFIVSGETPPNS